MVSRGWDFISKKDFWNSAAKSSCSCSQQISKIWEKSHISYKSLEKDRYLFLKKKERPDWGLTVNRAYQFSSSATGPFIVFEPCNVTTKGQVSLLSNPIITQKDWYTKYPYKVEVAKNVIPFHSHSCGHISLATPYINSV